jgi:hypothetical protein
LWAQTFTVRTEPKETKGDDFMPRFPAASLAVAVAVAALAVWSHPAPAQAQSSSKPASAPNMPFVKELAVVPAAAPVPVFKYRLIPLSSELNPGDAAPVYLRNRYEVVDRDWQAIEENAAKWLALPLDQFPTVEARKFVDGWSRRLKQIEFGTRRKTCDWNYTVPEEQVEVFGVLMPDAAGMRNWSRLLALKARVEVAEGKFDDAVGTMETGIAFGRHVAEGPFLINQLVGIAIASVMLTTYDDLISRSGAPNLYWALTTLPRPLIGLRAGLEQEMKVVDFVVPELSGLDRTRTDAEWSANLERLHARLVGLAKLVFDPRMREGPGDPSRPLPQPDEVIGPDLARFTATVLPHARAYLRARQGLTAEEAEKRPPGRAIAEYLAGAIRERRDEVFRIGYLSYTEAVLLNRSKEAIAPDPAFRLFEEFFPGMHGLGAQARLDRRVAALRVVEAVRMYAAAHGGTLPESLESISEVPVPLDPVTGKPFGYHLEGSRAEVSGPSGAMEPVFRLSYGITIARRKEPLR